VGRWPIFLASVEPSAALAEFACQNCLPLELKDGDMILSDVAVQELKLDFYMLVTYFINRMVG